MTGAAITLEGAGVRFWHDREGRPVSPALARLRRRGGGRWGVQGVDLALRGGERLALVGPSGSGKTTLLRLLAGVLEADAGRCHVAGRVASLLAVDAGVLSALTGRENAELLGVLAGRSRRESVARLEAVRDRSRLGDAFDRPVATWSQGMRARLGFAVADEAAGPEVLVLDEVHEALDHEFREVLARRAHAVAAAGGIVVAAGHDHEMLHRLCDRALLLRKGRVVADGPFADVRRRYLAP